MGLRPVAGGAPPAFNTRHTRGGVLFTRTRVQVAAPCPRSNRQTKMPDSVASEDKRGPSPSSSSSPTPLCKKLRRMSPPVATRPARACGAAVTSIATITAVMSGVTAAEAHRSRVSCLLDPPPFCAPSFFYRHPPLLLLALPESVTIPITFAKTSPPFKIPSIALTGRAPPRESHS